MSVYYLILDCSDNVVGLTSLETRVPSNTAKHNSVEVSESLYCKVLESMGTHLYKYKVIDGNIVEVGTNIGARIHKLVSEHLDSLSPNVVMLNTEELLLDGNRLETNLLVASVINKGTVAVSTAGYSIHIHNDIVVPLLETILKNANDYTMYRCMVLQELNRTDSVDTKISSLRKLGFNIGDIDDSRCEQVVGTVL